LLAAAHQTTTAPKASSGSKKIEAMRHEADVNARALATVVEGSAIARGAYDKKVSDYARSLGGSIPINPCTGTSTGYTLTVAKDGHSATVAAIAGTKCGKWVPQQFHLKL
jgi:hypothetical protein